MITTRVVCKCGEVFYLSQPASCWKCKELIAVDVESLRRYEKETQERVDKLNWFLRKLANHRAMGERGAGDTTERLLSAAGADWVKKGIALLRIDCGCESRRDWMNEKWPWDQGNNNV